MPSRPLIVLKFGGSILADEASLPAVVHDIYRYVRSGWNVLAVISAFFGETNRLLARARAFGETPDEHAVASLCATGELTSASFLALALDRAGVPAEVLDAASIGLRTQGPPTDAEPLSVDVAAVRAALDRAPAVVVPGFIGRDQHARTTLLGRGGSDATAIFLAAQLDADRCRLVKDVDGLYERDPAAPGPPPARFAELTWDDAARLGGRVLQPKAALFAARVRRPFEVAGRFRAAATLVGPGPTRHAAPARDVPSTPLRFVLLGHGVVGGGVAAAAAALRDHFTLAGVCVRDRSKALAAGVDESLLIDAPIAAATHPHADAVVELIGGIQPAADAIEAALNAGKHVVTANKAVIAQHGERLHALARQRGVHLLASASVGGAMPAIETVRALAARGIESLEAVMNGTTNFVLGRLAAGDSFDAAVRAAQIAGFAEADPSRDLDGIDAEDKLRVLAREAFGPSIDGFHVDRIGLSADSIAAARRGATPDAVVRHVVRLHAAPAGLTATIRPEALPPDHPLARAHREGNALIVRTRDATHSVRGKGAGRWPTTKAVLADLLDLWRKTREQAPGEGREFP